MSEVVSSGSAYWAYADMEMVVSPPHAPARGGKEAQQAAGGGEGAAPPPPPKPPPPPPEKLGWVDMLKQTIGD